MFQVQVIPIIAIVGIIIALSGFFNDDVLPYCTTLSSDLLKVQDYPVGIAINQNSSIVYVTNYLSGSISQIFDKENATIFRDGTILLGIYPENIVVNPDTNKIYVTQKLPLTRPGYSAIDVVSVLDGRTNRVLSHIMSENERIRILDVNRVTNVLYGISDSGYLIEVNGQMDLISKRIAMEGPIDTAVDEKRNRIYVLGTLGNKSTGEFHNAVYVIDGVSGNTFKVIRLNEDSSNNDIVYNPTSNKIYVSGTLKPDFTFKNSSSSMEILLGFVTIIDGNYEVAKRVDVVAPIAMAVNPNSNTIYVIDAFAHTILSIDGLTDELTSGVAHVGNFPQGIAVSSDTGNIFVANSLDDTVSVSCYPKK